MTDHDEILKKIASAQDDVLDLSYRNRLLNTQRSQKRSSRLEIVNELSDVVYRRLVVDNGALTFDARHIDPKGEGLQPSDAFERQSSNPTQRAAGSLQTELETDKLYSRLLKLYRDARTLEQEQGVNTLYLAMSFLKFFEDDNSDKTRYAPLILIPVRITRSSSNARFTVRYTGAEITTNLSLQQKLLSDFGIRLPTLNADEEAFTPNRYAADVSTAIGSQQRWEVLCDDIIIWFFSFYKFLMWKDLEQSSWPTDKPIHSVGSIPTIFSNEFSASEPSYTDDENIDRRLKPLDLCHVLDADSSQTVVIAETTHGHDLVVQGPPGTGKSQTIVNIISAAVKTGKTVLFVSAKMAALDVVQRRLSTIGLDTMCLELHSHKANKKAVVIELKRTLDLPRKQVSEMGDHYTRLLELRERLNGYVKALHTPIANANISPYQIIGKLVRLNSDEVRNVDLNIPSCVNWNGNDFEQKNNLLTDSVQHLDRIGKPQAHPWRGVELLTVLPADTHQITEKMLEIVSGLENIQKECKLLAETLEAITPETLIEISSFCQFALSVARAPNLDVSTIPNQAWSDDIDEILAIIEAGQSLQQCKLKLGDLLIDWGDQSEIQKTRMHLAQHGKSFFRIFNREYRMARKSFSALFSDSPPNDHALQLEILDALILRHQCLDKISTQSKLGVKSFGTNWEADSSNWDLLQEITKWVMQTKTEHPAMNIHAALANLPDRTEIQTLARSIDTNIHFSFKEMQTFFDSVLKLDLIAAFDNDRIQAIKLTFLVQHLESCSKQREALKEWIDYNQSRRRLYDEGLQAVADLLDSPKQTPREIIHIFQHYYYSELIRSSYNERPILQEFNGLSHDVIIKRFKSLVTQSQQLSRQELISIHSQRLPSSNGTVGEVGILNAEATKKRRHLPLRKLFKKAGRAIQTIKPVMLMSPLSVAQYLEPAAVEFDIVIFDEASQIRPADALGAIARANQLIVVGDDKQLPPTTFFDNFIKDDQTEPEAGEVALSDIESILDICKVRITNQMLRWHYRSLHPSLIAVSNSYCYDNKLIIVPSPHFDHLELGLKFRHIQNGVYDRGGSRTNILEAKALVDAIEHHAANHVSLSLGVGTFSQAQQDLILDLLEQRRRKSTELDEFINAQTVEPFFVKNLENIQGDERDVIFISICYAKDNNGRLTQNFGPLNNRGGFRRLNVLISRSRARCEVFSSVTADDIDLSRTKSEGLTMLKGYLTYAKSGHLEIPSHSDREHDSEFELQVDKALSEAGYTVRAQIGTCGFFIDLAIVDPDKPGRYLLGIECDGASYHSSRSARDRDRLRQEILEDRGWIIHRIWSTDWFQTPQLELEKVVLAIENAKAYSSNPATINTGSNIQLPNLTEEGTCDPPENVSIDTTSIAAGHSHSTGCTINYVEAEFSVDTSIEIHQLKPRVLTPIVVKVIQIEGSIHKELVADAVRRLWGLSKTGNRISAAVNKALGNARRAGKLDEDSSFYHIKGQTIDKVRNREYLTTKQRKPKYLPPAEIRVAILWLVEQNIGVDSADLARQVGKLFGFSSTSPDLKEAVKIQALALVNTRLLQLRIGKYYSG